MVLRGQPCVLVGVFNVVLQEAAARAAVDSDHDAHTFLAASEARAFEGLHCVVASQAAAAGTAANLYLIALSCPATSVAQAFWGAQSASCSRFCSCVVRGGFLQTISGAHVRFSLDLIWNYVAVLEIQ